MAGLAAVGATAALVSGLLTTGTANAAVELKYDITGSAFIPKMNTEIPIDATVNVHLDATTGQFTSEFKQKSIPRVKFKAFGQFDTELDVEFFEAAPSSGKIEKGQVSFNLPLQIRLQNIVAIGVPFGGGPDCVQKTPPTLTMASTGPFVPDKGGDLATSAPYTLSEWTDGCGQFTGLINMNSAGPDNTAKVSLKHVK